MSADFIAGKYSGTYSPAWGDEDSKEQLNLDELSSWDEYKALLSDGIYFSDAIAEFPSLDIPIIVYEYSNLTYVGSEEAPNPTFSIYFKHDSSKTIITGWGWNAGGWDADGTGYYGCSRVYVPGEGEFDKGATAYFIVIGEDIETPTVKGYINAGCDDGILSNDNIERYDIGWLENYVYDFSRMTRVMYLSFDVTIPANSSITVEASMVKDASIDYIGKNKGRNGYDMVTTLASPFTFTKQTASLTNSEFIEIIDQNFGFDLEHGITEVELDLQEEHYWMDVRKTMNEE